MHRHSQERQRSHSKRCLGNHRSLSSTCLPAPAPHMLLHPFSSHTVSFPQRPQHLVVPQWAANPPVGTLSDTFPSKASALCEQAQRVTVPNTHIPTACLFIPVLMEALTQGNLWGGANDEHVWDGPQQGVMDCPLGPAQLIEPLPSPCQPV